MVFRTTLRILVAAFGVAAVCQAQSAPPAPAPCPDASQGGSKSAAAKPCTPSAPKANTPSAAQQFPFPGESSQPDQTPSAPGASHPSAAAAHPYPGDPGADAGSSSSSSSSSSGDDGDVPSVPPGDLGKLTRRKPSPVAKPQTNDQRVDEDLRVAKFYINDDNLPGAYLRAKDAVHTEPDYSETHFMLGQVAEKMKKNQEAIAEYEAYLKMDPGGERTKEVTSALEKLKR